MYKITVNHQWICNECGIGSPVFDNEPELTREMLKAGWLSRQFTMYDTVEDHPGMLTFHHTNAHFCPVCRDQVPEEKHDQSNDHNTPS